MGLLGLALDASGLLGDWQSRVRINYPVAYQFEVIIEGEHDSGFESAKGLNARLTPIRVKQANYPRDKKIYHQEQVGLVTLERALDFYGGLERWYDETRDFPRGGQSPRRSVSIIQLYRVPPTVPLIGNTMVEVKRWNFPQCDIVGLTFPNYDAERLNQISKIRCTLDPNGKQTVEDLGGFAQLLDVIKTFT